MLLFMIITAYFQRFVYLSKQIQADLLIIVIVRMTDTFISDFLKVCITKNVIM